MKTNLRLWLMPCAVAMFFISCQKNDFQLALDEDKPQQENNFVDVLNQVAVIGDKTPNPYSLENMKRAYVNLFPNTKTSVDDVITATHRYIKFIPKSENDLTEIQELEGLELFLYPLDHEVSDGRIDVDPNYSVNGFQHRWCYVPVGYDLSEVKCEYEYLYDIYSPYDVTQTKSGDDFCDALEVEAYKICGMDLDITPMTKSGSVTPSGTIMFWDNNVNGYRGCKGLYVKAVRGTHSSSAICNANGQFTINDTFSHSFTYQIHFAHTDFMVRKDDSTSEIVYKYSDYFGGLYKTFSSGDEATFFAKVSRAAYMYYYEYIDGLSRPPMANDSHSAKLAIQAVLDSYNQNTGLFDVNDRFLFSDRPIVYVFQKNGSGVDYGHMDVFANTIHELTHAAHWRVDHDAYSNVDMIVKESLAGGIQWYLTNKEYPTSSYSPGYRRLSYTGIVQDLINGYGEVSCDWYATYDNNGDESLCYSPRSYTDAVSGYTAAEIEEAAFQAASWNSWYLEIYTGITNNDRGHVAEAFNFWNSI